MKNRTLIILLAVVTGLLILETGYFIGLNEKTRTQRILAAARYKQPVYRPITVIDENWSPFRDMALMQEKMNRMFDDSFRRARYMQPQIPVQSVQDYAFGSSFSANNTDQAKILTFNIPGMEKKDFDIEIKGQYLTLRVKKEREANINKKNYHGEESSSIRMTQVISIPENARIKDIAAVYNNGVLTITIPKNKEAAKPVESPIKIPVG